MNKYILEFYYCLKELFGPKIKAEILGFNNLAGAPDHAFGDQVYSVIKDRQTLDRSEVRMITGDSHLPVDPMLQLFKPGDLLDYALGFAGGQLVRSSQFSFIIFVKFPEPYANYGCLISSPLLTHQENTDLLNSFLEQAFQFFKAASPIRLRDRYLTSRIPGLAITEFIQLYELLVTISMQQIENKNIRCGLVFINDYANFKSSGFYPDLFLDIPSGFNLRDIETIRQPFLEIADGIRAFLIVEQTSYKIVGLFFPDKPLDGLEPTETHTKKMKKQLVVKIDGIGLTRVVYDNKIAFEIRNGRARVREYQALVRTLENGVRHARISIDLSIEVLCGDVISLTKLKKGTIIIIGPLLDNKVYSNGISGKISLYRERKQKEYRDCVLRQLVNTDGAILIDRDLNVYSIGAILMTGNKTPSEDSGNPSGSRSFAAKKFAEEHPEHLVIKISEDGPISVFFDGKCQIDV